MIWPAGSKCIARQVGDRHVLARASEELHCWSSSEERVLGLQVSTPDITHNPLRYKLVYAKKISSTPNKCTGLWQRMDKNRCFAQWTHRRGCVADCICSKEDKEYTPDSMR